ncbi:uncharacterized protein J4E87_008912 [Alternaria ethzedia]|uniref:uncharacterized protein n=1 Tax=Alternaria ethzedia TaxID=181014 RepID=UPI0020C2D0F6|nr:uncharacterized protein J4E87_008912 [Alternaria ethzedia]KAI4616177.1 hypothetical protein J4E87_008912 [Alternaria ethzedia]
MSVMEWTSSDMGESKDVSTPIDNHPTSKFVANSSTAAKKILYHAHTLVLFTCDNLKDVVIPPAVFGVLATLSGPALDLPPQDGLAVLRRVPTTLTWLWLMLLPCCLQNQRHESSLQEDTINKPWRPIPTGRINTAQTTILMIAAYLALALVSYQFNVVLIYVAWVVFNTLYHDMGGSDYSGISRNAICALGLICPFSGALSIALGPDTTMSYAAWQWIFLVTLGIIGTTIHAQDFRDEAGDRARGRRTIPIELGRRRALWSVVVAVVFWTFYAPLVFLGTR